MVHLFLHIWTKPCFSRAPQLWTMVAWDHRLRGLLYTETTAVHVGVMQVQNNITLFDLSRIRSAQHLQTWNLEFWMRREPHWLNQEFRTREFLSADSNKRLKCFTSETGFKIALWGIPDQSLFTFVPRFLFYRRYFGISRLDCRQLCQIVQKIFWNQISMHSAWNAMNVRCNIDLITKSWFFFRVDSGSIALQVIY